MVDELPTPYGLVRFGVAPDHQETKNVIHDFEKEVLAHPNVSFYGNVKLGTDLSLFEILSYHHTCVLSFGASLEKDFRVKGKTQNNSKVLKQKKKRHHANKNNL